MAYQNKVERGREGKCLKRNRGVARYERKGETVFALAGYLVICQEDRERQRERLIRAFSNTRARRRFRFRSSVTRRRRAIFTSSVLP